MTRNRETVLAAVRTAFPDSDEQTIADLLDQYGIESYEREKERVQLAIIALSKGDMSKLPYLIQVAKTDYRDVLSWVETGELSEEEGRKLREKAMQVIECWGDK